MDKQPDIKVTLTVEIRDPNNYDDKAPAAERVFTTSVDTDSDKFRLARANVAGLSDSALAWLRDEEDKRR